MRKLKISVRLVLLGSGTEILGEKENEKPTSKLEIHLSRAHSAPAFSPKKKKGN
jgi:hypothetical protein